jgi:ribosome biogenesis GTPase / thiamine phosphate phosphatase
MKGEGVVIKSTGSWFTVKKADGKNLQCKIKGKFRIKGLKTTNPVAVGDQVDYILFDDGKSGLITHIHERRNLIIRKSIKLTKQIHIIAANIDHALLIITVKEPVTRTEFIDRFLVSAESFRVRVVIIINKTDIYNKHDLEEAKNLISTYTAIGYNCIETSALTGHNTDKLKAILKSKTTLLAGNSGVGKSTLINTISPGLNLKTANISTYKTGKHLTTFAEMFPLSFGGSIIDTPGLKAFGINHLTKDELYHFFPEIFKASARCKYYNCLHVHEPQCAVKEALEQGLISKSRYRSYLNMLEGDEDKYR